MLLSDNTRVLIVHEDPIVAAGLSAVLNADPSVSIACAANAAAWLRAGKEVRSDFEVILADYQGALDLLAAAKESTGGSTPRVLVVSQLAREWEVRLAMNAGVFGYVLQSCPVEEIMLGVRMVAANRRYLCEAVAERIAESLTRVTLTVRETEVLELLQRGMCNKTIARDLGIAPGTVKAHVKGILDKLESTTRTQAVSVATQRGLIRPSAAAPMVIPAPARRTELHSGYSSGSARHAELA
jgi:DNA-binding NarL/FixJ family response regulator